jgi:hypothetical protein
MTKKIAAAAGVLALFAASPAFATITIFSTPPFPPNPPENVLLNSGATGLTVTGTTNQTGTVVNFIGSEALSEPSTGQARIEAVDGSFDALTIGLANPALGFNSFEFNLDALATGAVTLTFLDQFGTAFSGVFTLDKSGSNFFTAVASGGEEIKSVQVASAVQLSSASQVRLGPVVGLVPEPAAWALMLTGFFAAGAGLRRQRGRALRA